MLELPYPQSSTKSCPGDTRSTNRRVIRPDVCSGFPVYSDTVYHVDSINLIFFTCKNCTNTELNGDNAVEVTSYCCCIFKYLLTFLLKCIIKNEILTFTLVLFYFTIIFNYKVTVSNGNTCVTLTRFFHWRWNAQVLFRLIKQ